MPKRKLRQQQPAEKQPNRPTEEFSPGTFVFAEMDNKLWPGIIISHNDVDVEPPEEFYKWVFWFGDYRVSKIKDHLIKDFVKCFKPIYTENYQNPQWRNNVLEAIREFIFDENKDATDEELIELAYKTLKKREPGLTPFILDKLEIIKEKAVIDDVKYKIGADYSAYYKNGKTQKNHRCLGCHSNILADQHPIFQGYICKACKDAYCKAFVQSETPKEGVKRKVELRCAVCSCIGDMVCCRNNTCKFMYCAVCVKDFCQPGAFEIIQQMEGWLCFTCDDNNHLKGVLSVKSNWRDELQFLLENPNGLAYTPKPMPKIGFRVMNVETDCHGMCAGFLTMLKRLNINNNFSCKPEDDIRSVLPIDIIYGGIPNTDVIQKQRTTTYDVVYLAELFLEFFRVFRNVQLYNRKQFVWFFYAETTTLQTSSMISRFFNCLPVQNASLDKTLIWTNVTDIDKFFEIIEAKKNKNTAKLDKHLQITETPPGITP